MSAVHPPLSEAELQFVSDCFLSTQRLHRLLQLTVDGLYAAHAADIARHDRSLYLLLCLLCCHRLQSLGWGRLCALLRCLKPQVVLPLLRFLFDCDRQQGWLRQQWQTVYDLQHVEERLLRPMAAVQQEAQRLIAQLSAQLASPPSSSSSSSSSSASAAAGLSSAVTVPRPFRLSLGRAKSLPAPIALSSQYRARAVPAQLSAISLHSLQQEKEERRQSIRQQLLEQHRSEPPLRLHALHRPSRLQAARQEAEDRLQADTAQLSFAQPAPPAPPGPSSGDSASHRPTASSVLREEELYRRERAAAALRLSRIALELRDDSEFAAWQTERRREDDEQRQAAVAQRKTAMGRAAAEAQHSVERLQAERQAEAAQLKQEMERRREEAQREEQSERERKEEEVTAASASQEARREAVQDELRRRRRAAAGAVQEERRLLAAERERRLREELQERRSLLLRIQAMERLASARAAREAEVVEDSRSSGLMLLSDMSVVEMRARLQLLEESERQQLQRKRQSIAQQRQLRHSVLRQMEAEHGDERQQRGRLLQQARAERSEQKAATEAAVQQRLSAEDAELQLRLVSKREAATAAAVSLARKLADSRRQSERLQAEAEASRRRMEADLLQAEQSRQQAREEAADASSRQQQQLQQRAAQQLAAARTQRRQRSEESRQAADSQLSLMQEAGRAAETEEKETRSAHHDALRQQARRQQAWRAERLPASLHATQHELQRAHAVAADKRRQEQLWKETEARRLARQRSAARTAAAAAALGCD